MKRSVVIKRLGYEASAALDNLRHIARRVFIFSGSRSLRHEQLLCIKSYCIIDLSCFTQADLATSCLAARPLGERFPARARPLGVFTLSRGFALFLAQVLGDQANRRKLEQLDDRELATRRRLHLAVGLNQRQRVAAEIEEVVIYAYLIHL